MAKTKTPLVSVIIPFFNTGKSLVKLVDKLLCSFDALEIICVDDKSTDDSLKLIQAETDPRLKIIKQSKNQGSAAARNRGLATASGKYIVFLDSDDDISSSFINKMLSSISQDEHAVLAVCGIRQKYLATHKTVDKFVDDVPMQTAQESWKAYILHLMVLDGRLYSSVNKIYLGDVIRAHQLTFDTKLDFAEDTKFVLDYLACFADTANAQINCVLEPLYIYNYGTPTSVVASSSLRWENWQKNYTDITKWLGPEPTKLEQKWLKKLLFRFKISHALAVERADLSEAEKLQYLKKPALLGASLLHKIRGN